WRGSTPSTTATSSDSSNLLHLSALAVLTASSRLYIRRSTLAAAAANLRPVRAMALTLDLDAHRTGGSGDGANGGLDGGGVQVGELQLRDLLDLLLRDLADLHAVGLCGALRDARLLLEEHGCRGRLRDEGEGAIRIDGDDDGNDGLAHRRRARIERLAELHDVDALLAERGADGRRGRRFSSG